MVVQRREGKSGNCRQDIADKAGISAGPIRYVTGYMKRDHFAQSLISQYSVIKINFEKKKIFFLEFFLAHVKLCSFAHLHAKFGASSSFLNGQALSLKTGT